ncbi:MAG: hypothetical protein ACE5MK_11970 [Acidobacteriota bacterium]
MFESQTEMLRQLEASAPNDELTIATWNIEWLNAALNSGRVNWITAEVIPMCQNRY